MDDRRLWFLKGVCLHHIYASLAGAAACGLGDNVAVRLRGLLLGGTGANLERRRAAPAKLRRQNEGACAWRRLAAAASGLDAAREARAYVPASHLSCCVRW